MFDDCRWLLQRIEPDGTWRNFMTGARPFTLGNVAEADRHRYRNVDLRDNPQLVAEMRAVWESLGYRFDAGG